MALSKGTRSTRGITRHWRDLEYAARKERDPEHEPTRASHWERAGETRVALALGMTHRSRDWEYASRKEPARKQEPTRASHRERAGEIRHDHDELNATMPGPMFARYARKEVGSAATLW